MIVKVLKSLDSLFPTGGVGVSDPPQYIGRPLLLDEPIPGSPERLGMHAEIGERHQVFEVVPKRQRRWCPSVTALDVKAGEYLLTPTRRSRFARVS